MAAYAKDPAGRYFVLCLCEFPSTELRVSPNTRGIDQGIKDLDVSNKAAKR